MLSLSSRCGANWLPLRLSPGRFRLYACGLGLLGIAQIVHAGQFAFWDWRTFARAAAEAGTPDLLRPKSVAEAFTYLPGAAWLLVPLRHAPYALGFGINAGLMLATAVAAGFTAQRIYTLSVWFCLALILAWAPTTYALVIWQNSPLGLLFVLFSLLGFTRNAPLLTALPLALLLYKPTLAIPLIGLLILRRRGRELSIVALGAAGWYFASVAATGGDWAWQRTVAGLEHAFFPLDFAHNCAKAIGLTTLLIRAGAPSGLVAGLAALLVAASVKVLMRVPDREAYAAACLLGLVVSLGLRCRSHASDDLRDRHERQRTHADVARLRRVRDRAYVALRAADRIRATCPRGDLCLRRVAGRAAAA